MSLAEAAARELARRRARVELERRAAARSSLVGWFAAGPPTERGAPVPERWQVDALTRLEGVLREFASLPEGPRPVWVVQIDAPPQSGKSDLV